MTEFANSDFALSLPDGWTHREDTTDYLYQYVVKASGSTADPRAHQIRIKKFRAPVPLGEYERNLLEGIAENEFEELLESGVVELGPQRAFQATYHTYEPRHRGYHSTTRSFFLNAGDWGYILEFELFDLAGSGEHLAMADKVANSFRLVAPNRRITEQAVPPNGP